MGDTERVWSGQVRSVREEWIDADLWEGDTVPAEGLPDLYAGLERHAFPALSRHAIAGDRLVMLTWEGHDGRGFLVELTEVRQTREQRDDYLLDLEAIGIEIGEEYREELEAARARKREREAHRG